MTEQYHLAKNWWILYVIAVVLTAMAAFGVWTISWPAIKAAQAGQPLPGDWTWARIITADTVIVFLHATLFGVGLVQLLTTYTKEGVRRLSLFGGTHIRWKEVTDVIGSIPTEGMIVLEIRSATKKIRINVLYYKDKSQLIALLREHVPPSTKWR